MLESFRDKRSTYQSWLQFMFTAALPAGSPIPTLIRPHSARAGWATDRSRQEAPTHTLLAEGRWSDRRAMRTYIRTNVRDLSANADFRRISPTMRKRTDLSKMLNLSRLVNIVFKNNDPYHARTHGPL